MILRRLRLLQRVRRRDEGSPRPVCGKKVVLASQRVITLMAGVVQHEPCLTFLRAECRIELTTVSSTARKDLHQLSPTAQLGRSFRNMFLPPRSHAAAQNVAKGHASEPGATVPLAISMADLTPFVACVAGFPFLLQRDHVLLCCFLLVVSNSALALFFVDAGSRRVYALFFMFFLAISSNSGYTFHEQGANLSDHVLLCC